VELGARRPDYAFFENDTILNEALEKKGIDDLYLKAIAVGDAKSWKTSLDKKVKGAKGSFEFQNPSFQIDHYLHVTPVQWGILTNGRFWRIYHKETSYKLDSYYEIDLVTILETNDIEGFKYFYLFFRQNAFIKDASGGSFLERVKDESIAYAKKLGANLQKNVYDAMRVLSEGFFEWKDNALAKDETGLREVQENTLKLLYRLLFIFYAESLRLLDRDNLEYKKLSLESIKYDVANKIDGRELILLATTDYWNKLVTLFDLINEGSESDNFRIQKDILHIPAYNGGLFDPGRNPFLGNKRIGDEFIAKAINFLAREGKDFIDYSTLGTRQLGSIYEGLLEYKLKVAEGKKTFDEIKGGAIYLATDKGERKATGSYYTPDYIVKYIVRNTLEPILTEKRMAWKENGLLERPFLHDILSVRVLNPAMGSGHFLVEACEFLANRLVEAWGEAKPEELESLEVAEHDVHWARREVVHHCIFGVDLNPMAVELAKLSLWLETEAANKPLTFLDHHLKVGNSLIGAKVEDLKSLPSREKKEADESGKKQRKAPTLWDFTVKKHFEELLAKYGEFAAHPDDDLKSVKLKEQEYDVLQKSEINRRLHELANVWISTYFGAAPPPDEYAELQNEMNPKDFPDWGKWRGRDWFRCAQEIAYEKRFFHWELEFPESFYEKGAPKENPGWDAVVGNPPWGADISNIKNYLIEFYHSKNGELDSHIFFTEKSIEFLHYGGLLGYITPNTWLYIGNFTEPRKYIYLISKFKNIVELEKQIFKDAPDIVPLVFVLMKDRKPTHDIVSVLKLKKGIIPQQIENNNDFSQKLTNTAYWKELKENVFNIHLGNKEIPIIEKIQSNSHPLESDSIVTYGIKTGNNDKYLGKIKQDENWKKALVTGKEVSRYEIDWEGYYLNYGKHLAGYREHSLEVPKICVQYIRKLSLHWRLISSIDIDGIYYPLNNFSLIEQKAESKYALTYKEAILNSKVMNFYFKNIFIDYNIKPTYISCLPIRRISFTTPPDRRAALMEQAKALYSEFLGAPGADNLDRINRINRINTAANPVHPVQTVASLSAAPDSLKILEFINARLSSAPEEGDVVHDLLAYLAERMIEMNKEKNEEIKGFLRWLEGEIGAPVEELTNKTAIKEYYEAGFDALAGALAKNKKKLKEGYDPTRREPKEKLQAEFNASVGKLAPLLKRIDMTDKIIDQIVYKLYGLTSEKIKILDESISGGKDAKETEIAG